MKTQNEEERIAAWCAKQWGSPSLLKLAAKLAEESGEVNGVVVRYSEGRLREIARLREEVGDVLIVLSQIAITCGGTLEEIRAKRFREIQERAEVSERSRKAGMPL